MKAGIIDRFEGEWAVIEMGQDMIKVERKKLPANAREGDLLKKQESIWVIDQAASTLRQQQIEKLAAELWKVD